MTIIGSDIANSLCRKAVIIGTVTIFSLVFFFIIIPIFIAIPTISGFKLFSSYILSSNGIDQCFKFT